MKKLLLILILLLIFTFQLSIAQKQGQEKIDSLLKELPKAKEDTNKVKILSEISFAYYLTNPDKGLEYATQSLALAQKLNWKIGIADAYNCYGVIYWIKSQYPKALEYYFRGLKIYEELGDKSGIASNLVNIGVLYRNNSDNPKALKYLFKALRVFEELGDKSGIAITLSDLVTIYSDTYDYSKASEFCFRGLKIYEELGDKEGIALNLSYLGFIYCNQYDYPKALEYYFKALKINEELGYKRRIGGNLCNIGELYITLSKDTNFAKINERNEFVGLTKEINIRNGIKYSEHAAEIALEIESIDILKEVYKNLSEGYYQLGDYKNAYEYNEKSWKLKDSIFSFENQKKFKNLESARELEKKEAEIKIYQVNDKLQKSVIWGAAGLVSVVIFFLYLVWRQRRKSEKLLLNILPAKIASRLKKKEHPIADQFEEASVVFIDIVDFTKSSAGSDPKRVAEVLNTLYSKLDNIARNHGLEKIKTIGDCYMAVAGIPVADPENAVKAAAFATEAMNSLINYDTGDGTMINFRCGIDCGPVVAGVIGEHKFIYDLWGDTVNTASRMESNGVPGKIHCTERFKKKFDPTLTLPLPRGGKQESPIPLPRGGQEESPQSLLGVEHEEFPLLNKEGTKGWLFEERGEIEIKGKGMMKTYFLNQ